MVDNDNKAYYESLYNLLLPYQSLPNVPFENQATKSKLKQKLGHIYYCIGIIFLNKSNTNLAENPNSVKDAVNCFKNAIQLDKEATNFQSVYYCISQIMNKEQGKQLIQEMFNNIENSEDTKQITFGKVFETLNKKFEAIAENIVNLIEENYSFGNCEKFESCIHYINRLKGVRNLFN